MSKNTTAMQCGAGGETTGATDMTTQQPEALRLANILRGIDARSLFANEKLSAASAALENQHARITELESQLAQRFDAADMATASAQGFRDGVASLSANAGDPRNAIDRDALIDAIAQGLHGTWHCTRVWEAWRVGTMSQDDFEPVDESETLTEIADAVLALLAAPPAQPAAEASRFGSPELQAMVIARCVEKDQADSVLEDAADPLQGAANWLAEAHGQFSPVVLSGCLMIGYNRAKRLHDAALAARKQGEKQ